MHLVVAAVAVAVDVFTMNHSHNNYIDDAVAAAVATDY